MEGAQKEKIQSLFTPMKNELGDVLHSVVLYGSAARKARVEGSDIDLMIILDDTSSEFTTRDYRYARQTLKNMEKENEEFELHIQPPKLLSQWWELLLQGEPWTVTSMKDSQAIYDPEGFVETVQSLLEHGNIGSRDSRSIRMLERAREKEKKGLNMLENAQNQMYRKLEDAAQNLFLYEGYGFVHSNFSRRLQEEFIEKREILEEDDIRILEDLKDSEEVNPVKFQKLYRRSLNTTESMARAFRDLEEDRKEWLVKESWDRLDEISRQALHGDTEKPVKEFRERIVEEGDLSDEYGELIQDVQTQKKLVDNGRTGELDPDEVNSTSIKINDLESAVDSLLESDIDTSTVDTYEDGNPFSQMDSFMEPILEDHADLVKAGWILTVENFLDTRDATVTLVLDDLKYSREEIQQVEKNIEEQAEKLHLEEGFRIHPRTIELSSYWDSLRTGSVEAVTEIEECIPLYDPESILTPVKKVIENGKLEGTREALRRKLLKTPEELIKLQRKTFSSVVSNMYNATVEAGQAALLAEGVSPPVQKKVAETMDSEIDGIDETVQKVRFNVRYWKDYEHGQKDRINPGELQKVIENAEDVLDSVESLVNHKSLSQQN